MSKLLIDENLPATLAAKLPVRCMHACDLGSQPADMDLWNHARSDDWIVLTKDTDFFEQLVLHGPPPKVIWLRTGNLRRAALEDMLVARIPHILEMLKQSDLVEVHPDRLESLTF